MYHDDNKKEKVIKRLREELPNSDIRPDERLSEHSSMKVGGPCDAMIFPENIDALVKAYKICRDENYPVFITGNGSNIIVKDGGIRAIVLRTNPNLVDIKMKENVLIAECGVLLKDLADYAYEKGLSGLEFAHGIPGTLGGAAIMNAGAYGSEIKNVCVKTVYLSPEGSVHSLENQAQAFGYRRSRVSEIGGVVLSAEIKLIPASKTKIKALMDDLKQRRKNKQPLDMPSAGSVFKRPEGYYTGKLIQDCGLKGYGIGGAEVSTKHSGFIVNKGNATAADVINLIKFIQKTVFEKFGVKLETEVRIVGEE